MRPLCYFGAGRRISFSEGGLEMYRTFRLRRKLLLWLMMIVLTVLAAVLLPKQGVRLPLPWADAAPASLSADGGPSSGTAAPAEKVVYLTFDDGPSKNTAAILDVLAEKDVRATFFVIGAETERGIGLYRRILNEGHAIGLHTYTHRYSEIYESADAYLADIAKLSDHLQNTVGVRPQIFRFPGGSNNATASPQVLGEIKERTAQMGLCWFDWNALGQDDRSWVSAPEDIFQSVVSTAGDRKKIVVLMHDDGLRTTAADAVSMIIDHYRGLGYRFDVLSPAVEPVQFPQKR